MGALAMHPRSLTRFLPFPKEARNGPYASTSGCVKKAARVEKPSASKYIRVLYLAAAICVSLPDSVVWASH